MYKEVLFMKLKDLLLVADCNYHVFLNPRLQIFPDFHTKKSKRTIKRLSRYDCITCGSGMEHYDWIGE